MEKKDLVNSAILSELSYAVVPTSGVAVLV